MLLPYPARKAEQYEEISMVANQIIWILFCLT